MTDFHIRHTEPCPLYGTGCEYVAVANRAAASAERIKELEARVAELERRLSGGAGGTPPPTGPAYDPRLIGAYFDYARAMYGGRGGGGQG